MPTAWTYRAVTDPHTAALVSAQFGTHVSN